MVLGMTIASDRRQVADTIGRLEQSEAVLALRADELDMVMSHLEDGVAIIEEGGRDPARQPATPHRLRRAASRSRSSASPSPASETGQAFHPDGRPLTRPRTRSTVPWPARSIDAEEYHHTDERGVSRGSRCSAFPVPHAEGAPKRVMIVLRDITAASTYRESLVCFAGTVAHDLNNPLSVIDGWAEALEEDFCRRATLPTPPRPPRWCSTSARAWSRRVASSSDLLAHAVARDQVAEVRAGLAANLVKHIAAPATAPDTVARSSPATWSTSGPTGCCCARCSTT